MAFEKVFKKNEKKFFNTCLKWYTIEVSAHVGEI